MSDSLFNKTQFRQGYFHILFHSPSESIADPANDEGPAETGPLLHR
jgi:hypothetical protein